MALQYWCFTWNASNEDWLPEVESLRGFLDEREWRYVFQTEKVSRRHYQGRIDLKDKSARMVKNTLLGIFQAGGYDVTNLTVTPESNASVKSDGSLFYVTKKDSRIDGPWHDASFVPPKKPVIYNGEDLVCMETPLPWQTELFDHTMLPCEDDRKVIWICNIKGNVGKSKWQKWMSWKHGAERVPLGTATQLKTSVADMPANTIYMIDLPRVRGSQESQHDLFSAIEEIKNGWVYAAMYGKPHELKMKPPHVIVFSNELPDMSCLSEDKWAIYNLPDRDSNLVGPLTEEQIARMRYNSLKRKREQQKIADARWAQWVADDDSEIE